jgi:hypothetical protein
MIVYSQTCFIYNRRVQSLALQAERLSLNPGPIINSLEPWAGS